MDRLYYCCECKRVINGEGTCNYCNSKEIKELVSRTSVNVIGTKIKGKIFNMKDGMVSLIVRDEANNKLLKEYTPEQLKKVL